jgi:hypothetical protein
MNMMPFTFISAFLSLIDEVNDAEIAQCFDNLDDMHSDDVLIGDLPKDLYAPVLLINKIAQKGTDLVASIGNNESTTDIRKLEQIMDARLAVKLFTTLLLQEICFRYSKEDKVGAESKLVAIRKGGKIVRIPREKGKQLG